MKLGYKIILILIFSEIVCFYGNVMPTLIYFISAKKCSCLH